MTQAIESDERRRAPGARLVPALVAVLAGVALGTARPATAAVVQVTTTAQLEAAVANAHARDEIELSPGAYMPAHTLVLRGVTLRGPVAAPGARIIGSKIADSDSANLFSVPQGASARLERLALTSTTAAGAVAHVDGSLTASGLQVSANSGVGLLVEPEGALDATNSTISDNGDAGIVAAGTVRLVNATVTDNRLAGISDLGGVVTLLNTIVAQNRGGDCEVPVAAAATTLDGDGSCGVPLTADPHLGRLTATNGGPTATRALLAGSPAIAAGSTCPALDQRGAVRVTCDLGAYAYGALVAPVPGDQPVDGGAAQTGRRPPTGTRTSSGRAARKPSIHGAGAIRSGHGLASFRVSAAAARRPGRVVYSDPRAHVVFNAVRLVSAAVNAKRRSATLRGYAHLARRKGRLRFTVSIVRSSSPGHRSRTSRLTIRLSNGYRRSGRVVRGTVLIA